MTQWKKSALMQTHRKGDYMADTKQKAEEKATKPRITFSKAKILKTKRYAHRVDLLGILLKDGKQYTFDEVDGLLEKFMKGKVN